MSSLRSLCSSYLYALLLASFILMSVAPTTAFAGPVVQILKPQQGQVVSGSIWMDIAYSTNTDDPVTALEIYVDNELVRKANLAAPEKSGIKSFSWDFSFAAATSHTISAKAIDSAGASGSATISVTVRRAVTETTAPDDTDGKDVIPPTINIYYPAQGAKLSGLVEIRAEARDNVGVQQVYFYIDGRLHKMIYNSPPYYDQWNTENVADGIHVLEASAVDAANNEARSAQITVFVENHAMTRMKASEAEPQTTQPMTTTQPPISPTPATPSARVAVAPPVPPQTATTAPAVEPPPTTPPAPVVVRPQPKPELARPPVTPPLTPPLSVVVRPSTPAVPTTLSPAPVAPPVVVQESMAHKTVTPPPLIEPKPSTQTFAGQKVSMPATRLAPPPKLFEKPTLAAAYATSVTGRQSPIEFDAGTTADYTSAPRLGYPGSVLRVPETPKDPGIAITEFGTSRPVEIGRTAPRQGSLAVVRRPLTPTPAPSQSSHVSAPATLATEPAVPDRHIATVSQLKVVAPRPTLTIERPAIPPVVGTAEYSRIAALSLQTAEPGALFAIYSGTPRITTPAHVTPLPTIAPSVPVTPPSRTSTDATLTRSELTAAGQRTSMPQVVKPLPATAPSVARLDEAIPTFQAVNTIMPGDGVLAVSLPVRTTQPASPETTVAKAPTQPVPPAPEPVQQQPELAATEAVKVPASHSSLAMLPKGELPSSPAGTTRPDLPQLAVVESKVKDIAVVFDGQALELRSTPETLNGITTGPLRELFEHTDGVLYWFPITKEVRAINATTDVHLTIGNPEIDVNGMTRRVDLAPYVKRGRTMLPLQFIADTLDLTITYNPATQQIVVTSNDF